mgnify:FL=1
MDTKALRQKILDLAIRGKLVPQDPNDEPAEVLLERIREQKQQMFKEGKLKKKDIKNDTIIFKGEDNLHYEKFQDGTVKCIEDEIPFEVPEGWSWCRLRDLLNVCSSKRVLQSDWKNEGIPFYRAREIVKLSENDFVENDLFISKEHYLELEKNYGIPQSGDLMVSGVGTIGKVYIVKPEDQFYYKDASVLCFENRDKMLVSKFAKILLESSFVQLQMRENSKGTTVDTITISAAMNYLCIVPPQNEQVRIVAAVQQAIVKVNEIQFNKDNLHSTITILKSKILDLAIRGKLVPQDPNDEPASVLLERIRAEKEELIKHGKIKRDKKESVIFKGDDNSYYLRTGGVEESLEDWRFDDLPETWKICCLWELCDYGDCINVNTEDIAEDAWILDLEDIEKDTGTVLKKVTKAQRNSVSTKHKFHSGQVLYSKLRPYLNKVVLSDADGYCTSEILPLEFKNCVLPEYARYYLMSGTFIAYANHCSYGVKMPRLGTTDGKKAIFSLPPLSEQKRIVETIDFCFMQLNKISEALA